MKTLFNTILVIFSVFLLMAVGWLVTANDLAIKSVFAPKYEQVRRETFEQSKAYRQGQVQELENMRFEYIKAAPEHKAALASIIKHRAADIPENALPSDLNNFIKELP
jgi:hypothetical protein